MQWPYSDFSQLFQHWFSPLTVRIVWYKPIKFLRSREFIRSVSIFLNDFKLPLHIDWLAQFVLACKDSKRCIVDKSVSSTIGESRSSRLLTFLTSILPVLLALFLVIWHAPLHYTLMFHQLYKGDMLLHYHLKTCSTQKVSLAVR